MLQCPKSKADQASPGPAPRKVELGGGFALNLNIPEPLAASVYGISGSGKNMLSEI